MIVIAGLLALAFPITVWVFLDYIKSLNVTHEARVSELLTRIQHPEIIRPDVQFKRTEPQAPVKRDEMHLIGTVNHGSVNGNDES